MLHTAIDDEAVARVHIKHLAPNVHTNRSADDIDKLMMRMTMGRSDPAFFKLMFHQHQMR